MLTFQIEDSLNTDINESFNDFQSYFPNHKVTSNLNHHLRRGVLVYTVEIEAEDDAINETLLLIEKERRFQIRGLN
jgi:hypothetical protein